MNLSRLVGVLRRHWLIVALLTAAVVGAAAWTSLASTSRYRSSALLQVQAPTDADGAISLQGTLSARERAVTIASLGNTDAVAKRAAVTTNALSGLSSCTVSQLGQSEYLNATCTGTSRRNVAAAANAYAAALQAELDHQRQERIADLVAAYAVQIKTLRAQGVPASNYPDPPVYQTFRELEILNSASVPSARYAPQPLRTIVLALVVALIVNVALAFALDRLENRAATPEDLAGQLGLPLLGSIPRIGRHAAGGSA